MSALTRNRSTDTVPNQLMREYYTQRAAGGAGLIVSEGVLITPQGCVRVETVSLMSSAEAISLKRTHMQQAPGIWDEVQVAAWKKITDAVHEAGSKVYCQVRH